MPNAHHPLPITQCPMPNLILIVDDNDLTRMQLRELMQQAGYQVIEANNGSEGIAANNSHKPDIILLDALMPVMDGFTCCQELQQLPGFKTPVLMITALYDQESVDKAFACGATDYITKPIQWSVLCQRVNRLLQASRNLEELRQQTEQAQLQEAQLRIALEAARMGIWDWDILTDKVTWSENKEALFGLEKGSFDGTYEAFIRCVYPEDRDFVSHAIRQTAETGSEYDLEFRALLPDGSIRWMASKGVVFRDASGIIFRMAGVDIDITKSKQAEAALKAYANRQALVAKLSQNALAGCNLNTLLNSATNLISQNLPVEYSKVLELLSDGSAFLLRAGVGWQPGLVENTIISNDLDSQAGYTLLSSEPVIVSDCRTETRFSGPDLLHDHQVISGISVVIQGRERPFGILGAHTTQQRNFSQDDVYFLQAVANVLATAIERQRVEDALRSSEERWQLAVRGNNDGIWDWNVQTSFVFFSTRWKEMLGYQDGEIGTQIEEWTTRIHPDDIAWVTQTIQDHFAKKTSFYISEHRVRCKNGSYKWILDRGQALWSEDGNVVRMVGSHADITERKRSEEQLRQTEERFQILARATNDAVWDWDLSTDIVSWNESVQSLFGYPVEQVKNNADWWRDRIHPEDRRRICTDIQTVVESGGQFWSNEYRFRRSDGSYADIFDRAYVVHEHTGEPQRMIGAMMDISDRKRTQTELQRQNLRSQLFADITLKIRQSLQIDEILQTSVTEVQKLLNADRVLILRVRSDRSVTAVKEAVVPGLPIVMGQNINDPCFTENYIQRYRQGHIGAISDIDLSDIEPCHQQLLKKFAIKANLVVPILLHNELWGLLIAHQCTQPRQWTTWETELLRQLADQIGIAVAQAKLLEQETRQKQELARSNDELQQFAFVASHDLQEPLRKIKAFGDRLKASYGDTLTAQGIDYLERMQNAAQRMQTLIEDLLSLSRVTTRAQPFTAVNIFQLTQEVLSDLEIRIQQTGANIEIGELPTVNADPLQIRQLLQNLIGNALKFHRKGEVPIIKIYSQNVEKKSDENPTGKLFQLIIEDRGIGFDEKYLDRIFNVFQRLHGRSEYEGTGIGLAICRKIIERHQGKITAQSLPNQGAKFIVTLPINLSS
jgi:PAS domain S-box-containing protein